MYYALNTYKRQGIVMSDVLDAPEIATNKNTSTITIGSPAPEVPKKRRAIHFFLNGEGVIRLDYLISVSYTHLTLPTILLV